LIHFSHNSGLSFLFRINGRDIFAKGANYVPSDVFEARANDEKIRYLLTSARDVGMNMIRIWGGGVSNVFFFTCQEFMTKIIWILDVKET
jgi:beta-mannosidase